MAALLRQVISSGATPSMARLPMTREEVAASYAQTENSTIGGVLDHTVGPAQANASDAGP